MSIADNLNRIINAKAAIKQSLANKGVEVSDSALLDEYPALIDSIEVGSGEGGNPAYEDLYNLRTNNGTNMTGLFAYCRVSELDLSNLDTSKVTNMSYMFGNCSSSVNTQGWDTSNVTNMSYMFSYFTGSIDISQLDTSNVTDATYMFNYANTDNVILTGLSFPKCTKLNSMFYNVKGTTLDLSSWDISNITSMNSMFNGANYKKIDLTGWKTTNVTNMNSMFYTYNNPLEELIIPDWDMANASNNIFSSSSYISKLKLIDLSRSNDATITKIASYLPTRTATTSGTVLVPANTSQEVCDTLAAKYWTAQKPEAPEEPPVEDIPLYMPGEFKYDTIVTEVEVMVDESHDDLDSMFLGCTNLVSVNTEDWDTSNVTNMTCMFDGCSSLTSLNLSSFNTSNVTNMQSMFQSCTSLEELDIRNFDLIYGESGISSGTRIPITNMFSSCSRLKELHLENCSAATVVHLLESSGLPARGNNDGIMHISVDAYQGAKNIVPDGWTIFTD